MLWLRFLAFVPGVVIYAVVVGTFGFYLTRDTGTLGARMTASALLNIRHGLTEDAAELFRRQAAAAGVSHGAWLTVLVVAHASGESVEDVLRDAVRASERVEAGRRAKIARTLSKGH